MYIYINLIKNQLYFYPKKIFNYLHFVHILALLFWILVNLLNLIELWILTVYVSRKTFVI